ncbi:MAG: menaquinone biosynthesis protein [Proteobacteria bacterium]|nr:menaquinone biosynthesis protein [Pseudomonadota bacterium]
MGPKNIPIRLGKIGYLNVLPIYHPLETGVVQGHFEIVSGPPAELNRRMNAGELDISAASSIEYARHAEDYLLVPDLAIGSCGPVQSVLLLSQVPAPALSGQTILVSSQTHTSAALLKVLLAENLRVDAAFVTGDATSLLEQGNRPAAILAIGDEALELRHHPDYPHALDLGEAWRQWTGLPFIFGLWLIRKDSWTANPERIENACRALLAAKRWGVQHLSGMCTLAAESSRLDAVEMCSYFDGLVYDLGEAEQQGLQRFFDHLEAAGLIGKAPELRFLALEK